jgi:hypothetical protein
VVPCWLESSQPIRVFKKLTLIFEDRQYHALSAVVIIAK